MMSGLQVKNVPPLEGCSVLAPKCQATRAPQAAGRPQAGSKAPPPRTPDYQKAGNRFATLNAFVDHDMKDLTGCESKVWFALFRDERRGEVRTAQSDLARRVGANVRSVRRAINSLLTKGLLKIVRRGGILRGPSVYQILSRGAPRGG